MVDSALKSEKKEEKDEDGYLPFPETTSDIYSCDKRCQVVYSSYSIGVASKELLDGLS